MTFKYDLIEKDIEALFSYVSIFGSKDSIITIERTTDEDKKLTVALFSAERLLNSSDNIKYLLSQTLATRNLADNGEVSHQYFYFDYTNHMWTNDLDVVEKLILMCNGLGYTSDLKESKGEIVVNIYQPYAIANQNTEEFKNAINQDPEYFDNTWSDEALRYLYGINEDNYPDYYLALLCGIIAYSNEQIPYELFNVIDKKHIQRQQDEIDAITDHCKKNNKNVSDVIDQYHYLTNKFFNCESFGAALDVYEELQNFIIANVD